MKTKRTETIKIRLTPDELAGLRERKGDASLAGWVRDVCLGKSIPEPLPQPKRPKSVPKADPELLVSLARIGNNINQIAREAHTLDTSADKVRAFAHLAVIEAQLDELLRCYTVR